MNWTWRRPALRPLSPQVATSRDAGSCERSTRICLQRKPRLSGTNDEHLMKPWSLKMGGKTVLTLPRVAVVRNFVLNHNIHHRAQLGVYLRLNDIPVPSVYGPSADEGSHGIALRSNAESPQRIFEIRVAKRVSA